MESIKVCLGSISIGRAWARKKGIAWQVCYCRTISEMDLSKMLNPQPVEVGDSCLVNNSRACREDKRCPSYDIASKVSLVPLLPKGSIPSANKSTEKPQYGCFFCLKKYSRSNDCRRHMRKKHGLDKAKLGRPPKNCGECGRYDVEGLSNFSRIVSEKVV